MKTTHFLITIFLIVCLSANSYSQLNSGSKSVQVHNPDARFTMRVEKIWSNLGGQEEYRFYVQNNTSQEFKLTINVTLDLACVGTKSFDLGIGAWQPETKAQGRIVYLRPNGRFEPRNDYFHMYSGGVDNGRACRLTDGDSFTLLNEIQYNITSVINVTERKANEEQKKIKEAALKQKQLDDQKSEREAQAKAAADKKTIADAEKQKQAANSSSNNNNQSSSSNNNNNNKQSGEITNMSKYVGMEGSKESIKVYQQNGRYYIKSQNGSTTETDKQYFDKIQTVSARNAQIASNNEQIRKQNDPLANYKEPTTNSYNNNPMTNSNSTNNSYTQAANIIGSALTQWGDQMAANRMANEQRQQKQREEAAIVAQDNKSKAERYFKTELDKYLVAAENGDEKARMRLYFETRQYFRLYNYSVEYMIPKAEEWLIEAAKNKNNFAMDIIGFNAIYSRSWQKYGYNVENFGYNNEQGILLLEESASLGSLDAMMTLANYYNRKGKDYGSNAEKAFYYYSEASKKGSPTAMLHLGNIYRDQNTDIGGVKYKSIPKNNVLAFSWYSKSASCTTFKETPFGKLGTEGGSEFEAKVYDELATMFEKGLGVKKDKAIAEILKRAYYDYYDRDKKGYFTPSQTIYDDYLAPNLTPENTNRWGETENKTSSPLKSDNTNSTNNTINLLKSGNTNSANNTLNPLKTLFKFTKSDNANSANSATNTTTSITETSTLDEKAEYNKAKIDYKAGTISKEAYRGAIKKYSQYASYESLRLQKAFRNKEITRAEYTHAIKILLRK